MDFYEGIPNSTSLALDMPDRRVSETRSRPTDPVHLYPDIRALGLCVGYEQSFTLVALGIS